MARTARTAEKKPLILITPSYTPDRRIRMSTAYLSAIRAAGGIGVLVPYSTDPEILRSYAEEFDGFLFAGGVDLDPRYYGEEKASDTVEIDADRDAFELALFREVIRTEKPILGICRGIQLLNVALGGTLWQDLGGHQQKEPGRVLTQEVRLSDSSRLVGIVGREVIHTNSFHHQAVKTVAPDLRAVAFADSPVGLLTEAVESISHPFLFGVQWHPELSYETDAPSASLFRAFLAASGQGR